MDASECEKAGGGLRCTIAGLDSRPAHVGDGAGGMDPPARPPDRVSGPSSSLPTIVDRRAYRYRPSPLGGSCA